MDEPIEISIDNQGCIVIPAEIQDRLGLSPGMTLIVEKHEKGEVCLRVQKDIPELVEKQGVLVVRSKAVGALADVARKERDRHVSELIQRAGL